MPVDWAAVKAKQAAEAAKQAAAQEAAYQVLQSGGTIAEAQKASLASQAATEQAAADEAGEYTAAYLTRTPGETEAQARERVRTSGVSPQETITAITTHAPVPLPSDTPTAGWIRVDPAYAEAHPEATAKIGEDYYRPAISASQFGGEIISGEAQTKLFNEIIKDIVSGERVWGSGGWTKETAVKKAVKALEKYRSGDEYDIVAIALSDDPKVIKAAKKVFPEAYNDTLQWLDDIKRQTPELYEVLVNKGYNEYKKAYDLYVKKTEAQNKQFESYLQESFPDIWQVYQTDKDKGIELYNIEVAKQRAEFVSYLYRNYPDIWTIFQADPAKGMTAYNKAVEEQNKEYAKFQQKLASGEIIALPDEQYIAKEDFDKQPEGVQQILISDGFEGLPDYFVQNYFEKKGWDYEKPSDKPVGVEYFGYGEMQVPKYSKEYEEYNERVAEAYRAYVNKFGNQGLMERGAAQVLGFVFPPARAISPEATIKDISAIEWGLGAVNVVLIASCFAPGALVGTVAGKAAVTGLSTSGAGMIGYEVAKNWSELTPTQRALGVGGTLLYALPLLGTVARNIKISTVKIPAWEEVEGVAAKAHEIKIGGWTPEGEPIGPVTWKGVAVAQNPVIGISEGKFVVGARNITLPEARLIMDGYKPEMMIETKVFVNPRALKAAGFSETQIDYLTLSLKDRNLFAGNKSPFLSKEALIEPTQRLDADEISVLLRQIQKYNKDIKQVDLLYGSETIKAQLAPELRYWRQLHDWDIQTAMNLEGTSAFTEELLAELKRLPGNRQYRISPREPMLIQKKIGGEWKHIADIHSHGITSTEISKSSSGLDVTGDYSYGRLVSEPAITVEYPGIGKFDIMRLSESGVRKADTILRVRQAELGPAFRPPERGIASPGVPKDAADFYVILRTFKGEEIAEEWAEAWAKAMGYTSEELPKVLPKIMEAMEEVASQTPSDLIGYRLRPASKATVSPGASPTITIYIPRSLAASVSASLRRSISTPISPYVIASKVSPKISPALLSKASSLVSGQLSPNLKISARVSPKISPVLLSKASSLVSGQLSPKVSPSGSGRGGRGRGGGGKGGSGGTTPVPVPVPAPISVPIRPSPSISPPLASVRPSPRESIKPRVTTTKQEARRREFAGAITWRQGALGRKEPKPVWYAVKAPYASQDDVEVFIGEPPPNAQIVEGGTESAYRSIQSITGNAPAKLKIDLGIQDILVQGPYKKPGKPGAIKYRRDVKQVTTGDITIGPRARKPKVTEGTVIEPLETKAPILTNKMPPEVAKLIGSYQGKITPEGKVKIKLRML